jgi:IS605 OrfB family transposase
MPIAHRAGFVREFAPQRFQRHRPATDEGLVLADASIDVMSVYETLHQDAPNLLLELRRKLQKKGTKSAKRRLKKLAGKERRFATWVNHTISKRIVAKAQCTKRAIALEDLQGIRERVKARKPQRATLHSWSFAQLRAFVSYKAQRAGVSVFLVDPRNTSRTCPACGCIDKANRPNQSTFLCRSCGYSGLADHIAARNIAFRAGLIVNQPHASALTGQGQSPLL